MKKYTVYVSCEYAGVGEIGKTSVGRIVEAENETKTAEIALNAVESCTIYDSLAERGWALDNMEYEKTVKMYKNCKVLAVEDYEEADPDEIYEVFGVRFSN